MSESGGNLSTGSALKLPLRALGSWHGRVVHSRRVRTLAGRFATLLPPDHSVLDVGCGDGLIDAKVRERRRDLSIRGVDVRVRPSAQIEVTCFDGRHLPFPDQSFDSVLFCDVLHHTDAPVALLKEAVRVARHCILIKDHLVQGWLARPTLRFMDFIGNAPHGVVLPYNYLTSGQWDSALRECRLTPRLVDRHLKLYPGWVDLWFGRSLHFIGIYDIDRPTAIS